MDRPTHIWIFDQNRRVYRKDKNGIPSGPPIWRERWRKATVVGETSRSWITNFSEKIPKKGCNKRMVCFSEKELDRLSYVEENRRKISDIVICLDYSRLKQVADICGYKEEAE